MPQEATDWRITCTDITYEGGGMNWCMIVNNGARRTQHRGRDHQDYTGKTLSQAKRAFKAYVNDGAVI